MIGSLPTTRRVELLLRSASGGHYACRSLLDEAREELSALPQFVPACEAVSKLLDSVEQGMVDDFDARLAVVLQVLETNESTTRGAA